MPPLSGVGGQFLGSMFVTKYLLFVFAIQLIGGVLLPINRYVPLALTILGPIIVNILLFHSLMNPAVPPGTLCHDSMGRRIRKRAFGVRNRQ